MKKFIFLRKRISILILGLLLLFPVMATKLAMGGLVGNTPTRLLQDDAGSGMDAGDNFDTALEIPINGTFSAKLVPNEGDTVDAYKFNAFVGDTIRWETLYSIENGTLDVRLYYDDQSLAEISPDGNIYFKNTLYNGTFYVFVSKASSNLPMNYDFQIYLEHRPIILFPYKNAPIVQGQQITIRWRYFTSAHVKLQYRYYRKAPRKPLVLTRG